MRAAVVRELGATPEVREFDEPRPAPGRVLVRLVAAGLNPVDLIIVAGAIGFRRLEPPFVAGYDGVGELPGGELVYFSDPTPPFGSLAELVPVDEQALARVPEGVGAVQAAAMGVAGIAAWLALERRAQLAPGERVLVLGAGGSVGRFGIQIAKALGAGRVIAADRSEAGLRRAVELGADATALITPDGAVFQSALNDAAPDGFSVVLDLLWGDVIEHVIPVADDGARIVQVGSAAGPTAPIAAPVFRNKLINILGHSIFLFTAAERAAAHERLTSLAAAGKLVADVETTSLAEIAATWKRLKDGGGPKLVVTP